MSLITEIDEIRDMKIENEWDLRSAIQSARRRSLPALTISQTER